MVSDLSYALVLTNPYLILAQSASGDKPLEEELDALICTSIGACFN